MSQFKTKLVMEPIEGGERWVIREPLIYASDFAGFVRVPAGFICDLNSIPRLLWFIAPPTFYAEAGALHDWGYRGNLSRKVADDVYQEALATLGAGRVRQTIRYWIVRIFGRFSYQRSVVHRAHAP